MAAEKDLKKFTDKLKDLVGKRALSKAELRALGLHSIYLIVKRTRLGYGVKESGGQRYRLPKLSEPYVTARRRFKNLDEYTSARKSNLSRTGQMLKSMRILNSAGGSVTIGPDGGRTDSKNSNDQIAVFQLGQGRSFNKLSRLEFEQLIRFFRNRFADMARNERLNFK
jgi:hypothetical protein